MAPVSGFCQIPHAGASPLSTTGQHPTTSHPADARQQKFASGRRHGIEHLHTHTVARQDFSGHEPGGAGADDGNERGFQCFRHAGVDGLRGADERGAIVTS